MQPHGDRSNALDLGAAAALTVTAHSDAVWQCHSVTVMVLSWYWSHQPQGRACAAAPPPALRGTFDRTPYFSKYQAKEKSQKKLDIATRKAEK